MPSRRRRKKQEGAARGLEREESSERSGTTETDFEERVAELPEDAQLVWEQCTWVSEFELWTVFRACDELGLDDLANVPADKVVLLLERCVPELAPSERLELRDVAQGSLGLSFVLQVLANKRLLVVLGVDERDELYDLCAQSGHEDEVALTDLLDLCVRRKLLTEEVAAKEKERARRRQPWVTLAEAFAHVYELKVVKEPWRYPHSSHFYEKVRDLFLAYALPGSADGVPRARMRAERVLPALRQVGWFELRSPDAAALVQDLEQDLTRVPQREVDFPLFFGYAEAFAGTLRDAPPPPEGWWQSVRKGDWQAVLGRAPQVAPLAPAFESLATLQADGVLRVPAAELGPVLSGLQVEPVDRQLLEQVARQKGDSLSAAQWEPLIKAASDISRLRERAAEELASFWAEKAGKQTTLPVPLVPELVQRLELPAGVDELAAAKRSLRWVPKKRTVTRQELSSLLWYLVGKHCEHLAMRPSRAARTPIAERASQGARSNPDARQRVYARSASSRARAELAAALTGFDTSTLLGRSVLGILHIPPWVSWPVLSPCGPEPGQLWLMVLMCLVLAGFVAASGVYALEQGSMLQVFGQGAPRGDPRLDL